MFTVPCIQSEINLSALSQAKKLLKLTCWNEKENGDYKTELAAGTSVELKQEPALITDPNSDVGKCI
ncbi:hypothetical protein TNCV_1482071 [Trichonephila clavipes]|nr:hypothetical protein TNCV_1482071 [Trichonephila clavipes]